MPNTERIMMSIIELTSQEMKDLFYCEFYLELMIREVIPPPKILYAGLDPDFFYLLRSIWKYAVYYQWWRFTGLTDSNQPLQRTNPCQWFKFIFFTPEIFDTLQNQQEINKLINVDTSEEHVVDILSIIDLLTTIMNNNPLDITSDTENSTKKNYNYNLANEIRKCIITGVEQITPRATLKPLNQDTTNSSLAVNYLNKMVLPSKQKKRKADDDAKLDFVHQDKKPTLGGERKNTKTK